jgi:hypothetical protein
MCLWTPIQLDHNCAVHSFINVTILSFVNILLRIQRFTRVVSELYDKDISQTAITLEDLQYPYDEVMAAIEF